MNINEMKNCPKCGANWFQGEIFDIVRKQSYFSDLSDKQLEKKIVEMYGPKNEKRFFSNLIGVEIQGKYDGVCYWKCSECKQLWDRFTNEPFELAKE